METLTLSTPETTPSITTTDYRVTRLHIDVDAPYVSAHFIGTNGERAELRYDGAAATAKIHALNTANLSIKSLQRRLLELLAADGAKTGSVTGVPD